MLKLVGKRIEEDGSGVLFSEPLTQYCLETHWEAASGQWSVADGWLTGATAEDAGGMIFTRRGFPGDVMIDFIARTVPPCRNDLNFVWNAEGWDYGKGDCGVGYIGSLNGWWEGKLGLERYPDCRLRSTTGLFHFEPGREYHILAGTAAGHCFIAVDGVVAMETLDPQPIDTARYNRVGLGVYCSRVQFRDISVRQINWKPLEQSYITND